MKNIQVPCSGLGEGLNPPHYVLEYEDVPCACGKVPMPADCERFDLVLGSNSVTGEKWVRNTTRCKTCKTPTMIRRKN